MRLFDFMKKPPTITVEQVNDFYYYCEVAKCTGRWRKSGHKSPDFSVDYTRENGKIVCHSITLYCKEWAGHIYIENGTVEYRFTKSTESRWLVDCPITTNEKEVLLLNKGFFKWYNELGLPKSIEEMRKNIKTGDSVSKIKEITINAFGDEAVLRVMSDKKTFLIFNFFLQEKAN